MFYLSKHDVHPSDRSLLQLSIYPLEHPYRVSAITCHPAEEQNHYAMTRIDPQNVTYTTLTREEFRAVAPHGLHQHDYYEFVFVISGTLYQNIENERHLYPEGSCCLLNKNVRHCEEYSTDNRAVFLEISEPMLRRIFQLFSESYFKEDNLVFPRDLKEFFQNNLFSDNSRKNKDYIDFIPLMDKQWQIEHLHNIIEDVIKESVSPQNGSTLLIHTLFYRLFAILADITAYSTTPVRIGTSMENQLFDEITALLQEGHGHVPRSYLEERLNYSANYLNHITKKYTGLSLLGYGMTFCMKEAARLLENSDMNISDISVELGFSNRTQFYKKFQEYYEMTPSQFRKQKKGD